jgi:hypothetical protein
MSRVLEDWFGVEMEIQGDASGAAAVTNAVFPHASLEEVLDKLGEQQHFTYRISRNKVVITF